MKRFNLFIGIIFSSLYFSQVGINTTTPNPNSDLELASTNKGLLLNRVALNSTSSGVFNAGMLVYNTATANDVTPGVYISNGTIWTKLTDSQTLNSSLSPVWKTNGNSISSTDFIGTTNLQPLVFKTNATEIARIDTNGKIGIGTTTPQGILDVSSANSTIVLPRNANPPANVNSPVSGMIIYDSTNKTLRYFNGIQWSTVISSQTLTTANEGVVKMNSGAGVKPTFAFKTSGGVPLNTYENIAYQGPVNILTDFSSSPTTSWPENIGTPVVGDIYNQTNGRFLENPIAGQVHTWRVIASYSNKNNGSVGFVTINLLNPVPPSTFSIDQTAIAPNGVTTGNLVFYLVTVADSLSIGSGYTFKIKSDTAMDITIDSITRISQAKD
ncbi:uncharacterized protein CHSO_3390 [Chryseobacterium sp. StRB126]|uniref:hypothetical protein n=1 Tax=Chryseobacterium sp. StRB126 TaxID=878220 RepID=UPI0004E988A3|nr:hypothetical protein [Chryseobacterium sp. StRB126]BAP32427.1 uncharacterized protein CHSO_3390 [Chryseobacterium sp. StRB126]